MNDADPAAENFRASIHDESTFAGCDGGDLGTPDNPSIWLFGIEPGWSKRDAAREASAVNEVDPRFERYEIGLQLEWPFNRNAFKLLAALDGRDPSTYREFAIERRPFEAGSRGYFKGNLSPIPFRRASEWDDDARQKTGFKDRASYDAWMIETRLPVIAKWIIKFKPSLFIGVGLSRADLFARAAGAGTLHSRVFEVNGHKKRVHWSTDGHANLLVVPHLSGGANGLNSDASVRIVAQIARDMGDMQSNREC
jgi:hypothetical protein